MVDTSPETCIVPEKLGRGEGGYIAGHPQTPTGNKIIFSDFAHLPHFPHFHRP